MFPDSIRKRWPEPRLDSIAAFVAAYRAAGYDLLKLHDEEPAIADSVLAAARRLGVPVAGHLPGTLARALAGGMQSVEHGVIGAGDSTTIAAIRQAGLWSCPTLQLEAPQGSRAMPSPALHALQQAGVGLLLGSDYPLGAGIHRELEVLVQAGLTPYGALAMGTKNFGAYLQALDKTAYKTGTVAVGHRADLLLLSGNPLTDVRHAKAPVGVMIGGRWIDRARIDRQLAIFDAEERRWHRKANPSP
jgi:imidazolonepropionase-like amidohydrolase